MTLNAWHRPTEPAPASKDPEGPSTLMMYLTHAQWSRALDALHAGQPWALGARPRTVLRQVLNTAPLDVLDELLDLGLPVFPVPGAARPLLSAWFAQAATGTAEFRRIAVLDRLIRRGLDVNLADETTGTTFLAETCRTGAAEEAQALLDRGADPNRAGKLVAREDWLSDEHRDRWLLPGWTPLHLVARWPVSWPNGVGLAQRLLAAGADPTARTELPWGVAEVCARHQAGRPPTDEERCAGRGWTPLDVARVHGATALAAVLEGWELRHAVTSESNRGADGPSPSWTGRARL